jgi:hypothetical protein
MEKSVYLRIGRSSDIEDFKNRLLYRLLEIFPAMFAWGFLIGLIVLSFFYPAFVAIFIIAFDFYWLVKIVYLSLHLRSSYRRMKVNMKIDWWGKLKQDHPGHWEDIWHLVIFSVSTEPFEVVDAAMGSLAKSNYDKNKMIVVFATEERVGEAGRKVAEKIKDRYGSLFFKFLITTHPKNLPGEIIGKGSNEVWGIKRVKEEIIDPLRLDYKKIIVSSFDSDTNVLPNYFSILTYKYITHPNPTRASFQPVPLYTNNIWEAPSLARVLSFSSTFWHMMQQERPERQATFSSHSMSFQTLVDVGFWQTNIVSEDSRIFWQCYLNFDGDYETVSLFYPVSMDANVAPTFIRTMVNQYKQQRRWGWGVENAPYVLFGFIKNKKIALTERLKKTFEVIESYHSWATNALIIFLMGWVPVVLGGTAFNITLLSYNLPRITRLLMTLALIGVVSSMVLSINLLPPRPKIHGRFKYAIMVLQWVLLPLLLIFFGSLPALDAQSRLMFGGKFRIGFWVTPKSRGDAQSEEDNR